MNPTHEQSEQAPGYAPPDPRGSVYPGMAPAPSSYGAPAPHRLDDPRRKSPALACILSAMPGLGQIYVGYYQRGFAHAIIVSVILFVLNAFNQFHPLIPMIAVFLAFFWLYNIIDAGRRAAMFNHVLAGGEVVDLPQDIRMPGLRGSIVGGLTLIVVGGVILSNTAFDVPLDWLEDWWPVGLFLVGGYLVVKGFLERSAARDES